MREATDTKKQWSKPELKPLGRIEDVAQKRNTLWDGQSNNNSFGS